MVPWWKLGRVWATRTNMNQGDRYSTLALVITRSRYLPSNRNGNAWYSFLRWGFFIRNGVFDLWTLSISSPVECAVYDPGLFSRTHTKQGLWLHIFWTRLADPGCPRVSPCSSFLPWQVFHSFPIFHSLHTFVEGFPHTMISKHIRIKLPTGAERKRSEKTSCFLLLASSFVSPAREITSSFLVGRISGYIIVISCPCRHFGS